MIFSSAYKLPFTTVWNHVTNHTLLLATNNTHKVEEFRALFGPEVQLRTLQDVGCTLQPDETGATFEENAYLKAAAIHEATGLPCLADDSGLEVDALQGAPGVHSARYAGPEATDADNRQRLVHELRTLGLEQSGGAFRCVLCYVDSLRTVFAEGTCDGTVATIERGRHGFGYDALFTADGDHHTFAELTPEEKHQRSHRGRAMQHMVPQLQRLWSNGVDPHRTGRPLHPLHRRTVLLRLAYAAATGHNELLRVTLEDGVHTQDDAAAAYECLLQSYLFAGFPAAIESLTMLDRYWREHSDTGAWITPEPFDAAVFARRGTELCQRIYGSAYEKMMQKLDASAPDLREWMILEGYGKTLGRPGLDTVTRELCNVVILSAMNRPNQLASHVRGAVLVGATITDLQDCLDLAGQYGTREQVQVLTTTIDRFAPAAMAYPSTGRLAP